MDQRTQFIADYLRQVLSVTELCELYGVSRKTGYKLIERYLRQGPAGLEERSRRPHVSPNRTDDEIVAAILEARRRHPNWGGKKLLALLQRRHRDWELPHRSTVCDILSRHGMVPKKRNRRRIGHPGKPTSSILAPNDLWSADFKGQFKTGNGRYCFFPDRGRRLQPILAGLPGAELDCRSRSRAGVHACSRSTAYPSVSAPTTACPLRPTPWRGSRSSPPGGCG
jgi:transposase